MDIARKIGIAIVMIVPTFVVAGAIWEIFHSWFAVVIWFIIMAGFVAGLVTGKFSRHRNSSQNSVSCHAQMSAH